jgi:HSP20 family molecular chaperone IbpA
MSEKTMEMENTETKVSEETKKIRRSFIPRVDIFETENSVVVMADMPGVSEETVDITIEKDQLKIKGQVEDFDLPGYEQKYREYAVGNYTRSFTLSDAVNKDEIEATLKNGVLRIDLSKAESAKQRKIIVKAEN